MSQKSNSYCKRFIHNMLTATCLSFHTFDYHFYRNTTPASNFFLKFYILKFESDISLFRNEGGSLASVGITSGSVLWLLVKPVTGNNDREEIASLIRMSQSLANLRNLIRSLPSIDTTEPSFSGQIFTLTFLYFSFIFLFFIFFIYFFYFIFLFFLYFFIFLLFFIFPTFSVCTNFTEFLLKRSVISC